VKLNRSVFTFFSLLTCFLCVNTAIAGEKLFTKSKTPAFYKASEENTLMYFIHKDYDKKTQYIAIDKTPMAILPNDTYTAFLIESGWHLLTVAQKNEKRIESFEIYCYPGEIQVINVISMRKAKMNDDVTAASEKGAMGTVDYNQEKNLRAIAGESTDKDYLFYFDRYPEVTLRESVEEDKLKFVEITKAGRIKVREYLDECVKKRNKNIFKKNNKKLTFKEAVIEYTLPIEPPVWDNEWQFDIAVTPIKINPFKLSFVKRSSVTINKNGIEIQDDNKPEKNMMILFEDITGFERKRQMGQITPPYFLIVNYLDKGEEKQLQFWTKEYDPFSMDDNWQEWQKHKDMDYLFHPPPIVENKYSLTIHPTCSVGYHHMMILNDVAFWWERVKAGQI